MAAPDAYLFELLDLLQLAFPGPVASAEVAFTPTDDGARVALANLSGAPAVGASARPALGYPDDEVLDTINAVVGDVVAAVGGLSGASGAITFGHDHDGAVQATVRTADGREVYARRVDKSEQYNLIHTSALFGALNATEDDERRQVEAVRVLLAELPEGTRHRFQLDVTAGTVVLGAAPSSSSFPAELLASYHAESRTFVWGWANESFPQAFRSSVDRVRRGATAFGLRAFAAPELLCPSIMAERLARHAAVILARAGAPVLGVFVAPVPGPKGKVTLFLALSRPSGGST